MKVTTKLVIGATVAMFGAAAAVSAQGKAPMTHAQRAPMTHSTKPSTPNAATAPKSNSAETFKGIANKLGTTPDALETAYQTAKQANPKLTRGQFVSANMVAHNLSSKNPAITTEAILTGLQGGKSLGQTLQGLGLSEQDAKDAERQARRDAAAAQREVSLAPKPATP
jgi:hypothetical protein